jgi:tetraacyldisaccharide-1-P 4'-kinase
MAGGARLPLATLAVSPFGVVLGVARPTRVLASLAAHGLQPAATLLLEDHAPAAAFQRHARISMQSIVHWVTSAKCATKLGPTFRGAPLAVLDHRVELPENLVGRARGIGATTRQAAW